jgi:hypothetical protein
MSEGCIAQLTSTHLELFNPDYAATTVVRNVANYLPFDMA